LSQTSVLFLTWEFTSRDPQFLTERLKYTSIHPQEQELREHSRRDGGKEQLEILLCEKQKKTEVLSQGVV
jgi:hypothetical protein